MRPFAELGYRGQVGRLKLLAAAALESYGLAGASLRPLDHGENTTFRATAADGGQFVLRIHRPGRRTRAEVESEMAWLAALRRDTDLVVPGPVAASDGALVVEAAAPGVPEPRLCVLLRWVAGRFIERGFTPALVGRIGAFMARLHDHSAAWERPPGFVRGRIDALVPADRFADPFGDAALTAAVATVAALCAPGSGEIVAAAIGHIRQTYADLGLDGAGFGLIHADLHQENLLFAGGAVQAIDFDDCGFGPLIYDLVVLLRELSARADYPALRTAMPQGYRSVRPLPAEHEQALEAFFALRRLQMLLWVLEMRHHPAFTTWHDDAQAMLAKLDAFNRSR